MWVVVFTPIKNAVNSHLLSITMSFLDFETLELPSQAMLTL